MALTAFHRDRIWTLDYPVRYADARFNARMSGVRLDSGALVLYSPSWMTPATLLAIQALGDVTYIVAPGWIHHLDIAAAQRTSPSAETYVCPGIERKKPNLSFDCFLGP